MKASKHYMHLLMDNVSVSKTFCKMYCRNVNNWWRQNSYRQSNPDLRKSNDSAGKSCNLGTFCNLLDTTRNSVLSFCYLIHPCLMICSLWFNAKLKSVTVNIKTCFHRRRKWGIRVWNTMSKGMEFNSDLEATPEFSSCKILLYYYSNLF